MTGWIAAGIVAGLVLAGYGLQTFTQALRSTPIDTKSPGPLIQRPDSPPELAPPPSLSLTQQLVEDATVSPSVAQHRLWPLLRTLARNAGVDPAAIPAPTGDVRRWLAVALQTIDPPATSAEPPA